MANQNTNQLVVHIARAEDQFWGNADYVAQGVKAAAGLKAFRNYEWLANTPELNASKNFRGMVLNARWRVRYNVISDAEDVVGNVAVLATVASNVVDLAPQFEAVYNSNDSAAIKGLKYTTLAGAVAQRTLAGTVTGGTHLLYQALEGVCMTAGAIGGSRTRFQTALCVNLLQDADTLVQNTVTQATDPTNQQNAMVWIANLFVTRKAH